MFLIVLDLLIPLKRNKMCLELDVKADLSYMNNTI